MKNHLQFGIELVEIYMNSSPVEPRQKKLRKKTVLLKSSSTFVV